MKDSWRQYIKKPMALLLAAVLIVSMLPMQALSVIVAVDSAGAGTDQVLTGWKRAPVDGYTGSVTQQDGATVLKTQGIFGVENEKLMAVGPTDTYSLSWDAELSDGAELSAYIFYFDRNGDPSDMPFYRLENGQGGQFTVPADGCQAGIRFVLSSRSGEEVTASLQNVTLRCVAQGNGQVRPVTMTAYDAAEQKLLQNMRDTAQNPAFSMNVEFEDSETLPWTLWTGATVADGVMTQSAVRNGYAEGTQHYAVVAGETYVISAKIKATGKARAVYWLYEYDASGKKVKNTSFNKTFDDASEDWVDFVYEYTPGANVVSVQFHLQSNQGKGETVILWESVTVKRPGSEPEPTEPVTTEPPATEPPATEPPVTEPPVTENPEFALEVSFEDGQELPWTLWTGATVADGVMTQSADKNGYAEGSQHYAVAAGETYVISAKIQAAGRAQAVYWLYEYNANGIKTKNIPATKFFADGSDGWEDFVYEYTPSENVTSVQFHIQTNEGQNKGGSIQWDDVKVQKKGEEPPTTEPPTTEPPTTEPPTTEPPTTEPPVPENPEFALEVNFEDGEELPWTLWTGATVADGVMTQSADQNGYAEGSQHYAVTAGETYVLSAKIKATGRSQAVYWLYEYNADGGKIKNVPATKFYTNGSDGWVDFIYEYTPGANVASVQLHIQTNEGQNKGGSIQWDYVKVHKKGEEPPTTEPPATEPPTTDPSVTEPPTTKPPVTEPPTTRPQIDVKDFALDVKFDADEVLPWSLWSGATVADGVLTQSADSNGYAEGNQPFAVTSEKTYVFSSKIKATGRSQAIYWIWEYDAEAKQLKTIPFVRFYEAGSDGWQDFTVEYTPSPKAAYVLFHLQTNEGQNKGGSVQWDYVTVQEKEAQPIRDFAMDVQFDADEELPWSLWSGAAVADGVLTQSADSNGYAEGKQLYKVETGKTYTLSAKIQAAGRSQAIFWIWEFDASQMQLRTKPFVKFYEAGSNGWDEFTAEYTPSADAKFVQFHLQTNEGQNKGGSVQWDYVTVQEKEEKPIPDFALDIRFDEGEELPWKLWSGAAVADGVLTQSADSNGYAEGNSPFAVTSGKTYVISSKIQATGRAQAIYWIWEYDAEGTQLKTVPAVKFYEAGSNGWADFQYEYTPGENVAYILFHLQTNEGQNKGGSVQWDYVTVQEKVAKPITDFAMDVKFEEGEELPWSLWGGSTVSGGVLTQSADSNGYAEGKQLYKVDTGKLYTLSAEIKATGRSQAIFWIWEFDEGKNQLGTKPFVKFYEAGSNGWETFTAEYIPSANARYVLFHLQTNEGQNQGGTVQWDSVTVTGKTYVPAPPDTCVPPNGNFEQGNKNWDALTQGTGSFTIEDGENGKYAKGVLGAGGGQVYAYSQQVPVKPNYVYTISYRVNVMPDSTKDLKQYGAITSIQEFSGGNATGYQQSGTARNQTAGWETVTFEFITSGNAEAIRIDIMYANNPGTVLWDDFSITEKEAYKPVLLDAKYDHGGTAETASKDNVIPNGTFDGGIIQGWSPKDGIAAFRTKNENGGVVRFLAKPGSYLQSNELEIQGESEYQLTYYVKVEDANNLEFISYFFTNPSSGWKDFLTTRVSADTDGKWQKVQVTFATPELPEGAKGFIGFKSVHIQSCQSQLTGQDRDCTCHGSATIYLDDISLIRLGEMKDVGDGKTSEDSVLYNGTFDRYYSDPKTVDGWSLNPLNPNHDTYIQSEISHSGNAIAIHATGHSYIYAADFTVEPGNIYLLSYWVKVDKAVGLKFAPYMNDGNYKGGWWLDDAAQPLYDVTDGWVKITSAVTIPESVGNNKNNPESKVQLGFQVYEGGGIIYLDDVSFVKTDVDAENANLDFELSGDVLYNWASASYGGKGSVKPSGDTRPGGGSVSAQVSNVSNAGNTLLISKKIAVQPDTTYEFSYWIKTSGNYDTLVTNYFRQLAADGVSKATSLAWDGNNMTTTWSDIISPYWHYQVQGEVGWRQVTMSVTTGKNTHFLELRLSVNGSNTTAWFDDVSLRQAPQTVNMDFETTSAVTGAPANWHLSTARSYNIFAEADNMVYHSGEQSYHIYKDSLLENSIIDSSAYLPVSPDNTYEFSFWVSSRNCSPTATIRMNIQLYRADGTRIYMTDGNYQTMQGTVVDLNSGSERSKWTKVVTRAKPVDGAAYATISFMISRGDAEVWIDDIFFNVVEDGTDCVVYYDDFHAVDESGKTGDWTLETHSGDAAFTAGGAGILNVSGEAYIYNEMKQIATDYTYTIRGKYTADIGGTAELRFYDYKHQELEDTRVTVPILADAEEFTISFTAPSNAYTRLYIGSDQEGTLTLKDVTVYMIAKSSKSADWDGFWVWYPENPVDEAVEQYRFFRYTFYLDEEAEYAPFQLTVDDKYAFYLNGELIDENWDVGQDSWANVASYDLTDKVQKGKNVIALKCYNLVSEAAVLFDGKFTLKDQTTAIVASNNTVRSTKTVDEQSMDWIGMDYDDSGWIGCKEYGQPPCSPWGPVFYNTTLYIKNTAQVISTSVPESVTAGRDLEFTVKLYLDSPIQANFTPTVTVYRRNSIQTITSIPLTFVTYDKPLDWPVGEEFEVRCRVSVPDYFESGKYTLQMDENMLLLTGDDIYENKFLDFKAVATDSGRDNVESSVEVYNGAPTLMIDGQPVASHFYLRPDLNVYLQTDAETRIYKSGLDLYITYGGNLYKGGCDPIWLEDGTIDYDAFDEVIYDVLAANNDALVMVQIGMFAPPWWIEQNPDHELLCDNGSQYIAIDNEVSLASEKFREEAGEVLRLLIRHMKEQSYYNRVFGLKIGGGQSYEWMIRGTGSNQGPDYSLVSREGFKKYLKKIYGTDEALQEAWGDSTVTLDTAEAPGWSERNSPANIYSGSAYSGKLSRNIVDWNLWLNEASADSFLYYCQIAKEETDGKIIVGGYNGYLWTSNSYDSQGMAHTAAERVLDSEYVDWIASPISYNERILGQSNTYMALIDSVQEHGKLYIAEQDNRTYLSSSYAGAPWDANWDFSIGQTRTVADTIMQQKRDFANAMINGAGLWQYDMYGGWLDDDQIYQYLRDAKAEYDFSVFMDRDVRNEVAIFVGDETYAYMRAGQPNMPYTLFEPMLMQQRKHLAKMGTGYDTYTLSSLMDGKVEPHKLNIIFSPFEITPEMNEAIDKYLKCNGQYVVWVYLPGISNGDDLSAEYMKQLTGFDIGLVEEKSGLQVKLADTDNVLTQGIAGLIYGNSTPNAVSPLTYISNTSGVQVLGYNMDGAKRPGLGLKDMGDWVSIYSAAPCLDVRLLRNMLKLADCHVYSQSSEDVIYSNNHYVALHSDAAGEKTITLPGNYAVYDVFEEQFVSMNTNTVTFYNAANDTHIFRLTTPDTYAVTARVKSGKGTLSAPGLTEVAPGESYSLTVTPEEGYEVSSVMLNGEAVELQDNVLSVDAVNENNVIEVKFNKLPEMVAITEYVQELIILPWPAAIAILAVLSAAIWGISRGVKALRRKFEEGGY
ncbi:MAG: beta-galactosidase [Oscillospiraceae bacterium]|nr:beta-galactosidase [Oscillospiraceae bacterium]